MAVQALCSPELILTLHHQLKSKFRRSTELCRSTWKICQNMVRTTLHLKYSWALPFSSCSYMLKLWVNSVCPQMTVAKVENCWLYDSYPPVPPPMISHMQYALRQANFCLPSYSFVHQIEGLSFRMSHRCLWTCRKTGFQTLAPWAYPTYCSTTVLYFVTNFA